MAASVRRTHIYVSVQLSSRPVFVTRLNDRHRQTRLVILKRTIIVRTIKSSGRQSKSFQNSFNEAKKKKKKSNEAFGSVTLWRLPGGYNWEQMRVVIIHK